MHFTLYPNPLHVLSEGFGDLASLEDLDMSCCTNVRSLPESFCRLNNLKKLDLSGKYRQDMKLESLPEWFGELHSLQELNLYMCTSLLSLPAGIHTIDPACSSQ